MGTAARQNRLLAADYFLAHPESFNDLLQLTFDTSYSLHYKAAWVVEFVVLKNPAMLLPNLGFFTRSLSLLKKDSAVRPIAKVCSFIIEETGKRKTAVYLYKLTSDHQNLMIEAAFDWLIGDYRVASKVHAMQIIYDLGRIPKAPPWVLESLKSLLSENISTQTPGYQIRAKKILAQLK